MGFLIVQGQQINISQTSGGPAFTISSKSSGNVLTVPGGSASNGTMIQQTANSGLAYQEWQLLPTDSSNAYFMIASATTGKVLDVQGGGGAVNSGAPIQQWDYSGGDNQKWQLIPLGGTYVKIVSKLSGLVLDGSGGGGVQQSNDSGADSQKWQVASLPYNIKSNMSGKLLDVPGSSMGNMTLIEQWDYDGGSDELWQLIAVDGLNFQVQSVLNALVLD